MSSNTSARRIANKHARKKQQPFKPPSVPEVTTFCDSDGTPIVSFFSGTEEDYRDLTEAYSRSRESQ